VFYENFATLWVYFIGFLFVFVVMFLPNGIVGLLTWLRGFRNMHDGSKN
jgi:ABC-type branched-subunit amino acid transport system permease subunit